MKNKYGFLFLLTIVVFMTVYINSQVSLFLSVIFFIYTSIPGLILYYLFYLKKVEFKLRFILLVVFGYSWATLTSLLIKETYINVAIFSGISIGILASFFSHFIKNRKKPTNLN